MSERSNPMSYGDSDDSGIPWFSPSGTAYSAKDRQKIADQRGICLTCGVQVAEKKLFGNKAITNKSVYKGICIKCNGSSVPSQVFQEWQQWNALPSSKSRLSKNKAKLRTAAHAAVITAGRDIAGRHQENANTTAVPGHSARLVGSNAAAVPQLEQLRELHGSSFNSISSDGSANGGGGRNASSCSLLSSHSQSQNHGLLSSSNHSRRSASSHSQSQNHGLSSSANHSRRSAAENLVTRLQHSGIMNSSLNHTSLRSVTEVTGNETVWPEDYRSSLDVDSFSIVKEIQDHRDLPQVLKEQLHGLRNLADDQAGALYEIRDLMERYSGDRNHAHNRLITVAISAIWGICSKDNGKKQEAADTGCLDLLLDIMSRKQDDSELMHWALGTLSSLALLKDNCSHISQKGGVERILDTLKKHESHPPVFEWASRALYVLITPIDDIMSTPWKDYERNMVAVEEYDGIEILISAMRQHLDRDPIAEWWAVKVLHSLLGQSDDVMVRKMAMKMINCDLLVLICKLLNARSTTTELFIATTETLFRVLAVSECAVDATQCIRPTIRCLGNEEAGSDLIASGAGLLAIIARGNHESKSQIIGSNCFTVKKIITSACDDVSNLDLVQNSLFLLCSLSSEPTPLDSSILSQANRLVEAAEKAYSSLDVTLNSYICDYVCNSVAAGGYEEQSLPIGAVAKICSLPGAIEEQQKSRAVAMLSSKFPEHVLGSFEHLDACGAKKLLENLCTSNADVQVSSCSALAKLVINSEDIRNTVVEEGGLATVSAILMIADTEVLVGGIIELISGLVCSEIENAILMPKEIFSGIVQAMRKFPSLTKSGCIAIRNCALVTVTGVAVDGIVESLLRILETPDTSDDVLIEACGALWAFCSKQMVKNSDLSRLLSALLGLCDRHKGHDQSTFNAHVMLEAAGALSSVLYRVREDPVKISENAVDMIIAVLDVVILHDRYNVDLMDRLLDGILSLCFLCKDVLVQFGVIVVVIDCMVEHEDNEKIQQQGCAILSILASTEDLQVLLSIAETEGIDLIVSALASYPSNVRIQTDSCRALSHLSVDAESSDLICSQGGLVLLVNAINSFPEDTDLLQAAYASLMNLVFAADEEALLGSNVIETVLATMNRKVGSSVVQSKCLGVLKNISSLSQNMKLIISKSATLESLALTMREYLGSPDVMEGVFTLLWSLGSLDGIQDKIAEFEGLSLIINGMLANVTFENVQYQACGCLSSFTKTTKNKRILREGGAIEAVLYAMWAHYSSDVLLAEACRALSNMAVNPLTNEVMIASEGEVIAIIGAMKRFPTSEKVQEHGCVALRNFLLSVDNLVLIQHQRAEVTELMNGACTRFPSRCGERARQILECIGT